MIINSNIYIKIISFITLIFLLILFFYLYDKNNKDDLKLSNLKLSGIEYNSMLVDMSTLVQEIRGLSNIDYDDLSGYNKKNIVNRLGQLDILILDQINNIDDYNKNISEDMNATVKWNVIKYGYYNISNDNNLSDIQRFGSYVDVILDIISLIDYISIESTLKLDLSKDRYYLSETNYMILPEIIENLAKTRGHISSIINEGSLRALDNDNYYSVSILSYQYQEYFHRRIQEILLGNRKIVKDLTPLYSKIITKHDGMITVNNDILSGNVDSLDPLSYFEKVSNLMQSYHDLYDFFEMELIKDLNFEINRDNNTILASYIYLVVSILIFSVFFINSIFLEFKRVRSEQLLLISNKESIQAKIDAELANKMKSEFLANMSHELRTPLNSILILSECLKTSTDGNMSEQELSDATIVHSSATDLLALINDILDLSKVEAGKMDVKIDKVNIVSMISGLKNKFDPIASKKKIKLTISVEEATPDIICTDKIRLEQILRNLLSNAIKFTEEGFVILRVYIDNKANSSNDNIVFSVKDSGIGISDENKKDIFLPFRQVDGSIERKYGGTGLGLAITQKYADILGGNITMDSQEGYGSNFMFNIPMANAVEVDEVDNIAIQQPEDNNIVHIKEEKLKEILIVEDDVVFANVIKKELFNRGHKYTIISDGIDALNYILVNKPDAIILDIELPSMSGIEIFEAIKSNKEIANTPVYFMSIHDDDFEMISKGAIGYLIKPVSEREINKAVDEIEFSMYKKVSNILLAESDTLLRNAISETIRAKNIKVSEVNSSKEVMDLLLAENDFDLLILDLDLSDASGIDLLETLSNKIIHKTFFVIAYSSNDLTKQENDIINKYDHIFIAKEERSIHKTIENILLSEYKKENINTSFKLNTVLLVDDDMRNIIATTRIIEKNGYDVITAMNGREAISQLNNNKEKIGIVLMDIMMPVMNGLEAITEIRKDKTYENLPIIVVTAKVMMGDIDECLNVGANDYVSKPVNSQELLEVMVKYLPSKK